MNLRFAPDVPEDFIQEPILISGIKSKDFDGLEYLLVQEGNITRNVFEIRYEHHCSPFKQGMIRGRQVAVGHKGFFYLFDLSLKKNLLILEMQGYFGHMYLNDEHFYISDSASIHCVNHEGKVVWQNTNLGIDGVIVEKFQGGKIYGSGEWDPPGGWIDFILEEKTGIKLKEDGA
jgi:hypothetical protein